MEKEERMKVLIDTRMTISPNEQVLLEYLKRGENDLAFKYLSKVKPNKFHNVNLDYMKNLQAKGYVKTYTSELSNVVLTEKALGSNVRDWIQDYRNLFPKYKKGDKKSCVDKMADFLSEYPEYDKATIMTATREYIRSQDIAQYVNEAHNFIMKNKTSKLAAYCEAIEEKEEGGQDQVLG